MLALFSGGLIALESQIRLPSFHFSVLAALKVVVVIYQKYHKSGEYFLLNLDRKKGGIGSTTVFADQKQSTRGLPLGGAQT